VSAIMHNLHRTISNAWTFFSPLILTLDSRPWSIDPLDLSIVSLVFPFAAFHHDWSASASEPNYFSSSWAWPRIGSTSIIHLTSSFVIFRVWCWKPIVIFILVACNIGVILPLFFLWLSYCITDLINVLEIFQS